MSEMRLYCQKLPIGAYIGGKIRKKNPRAAMLEITDYGNCDRLSIRVGNAWVAIECSKDLNLPKMLRQAL